MTPPLHPPTEYSAFPALILPALHRYEAAVHALNAVERSGSPGSRAGAELADAVLVARTALFDCLTSRGWTPPAALRQQIAQDREIVHLRLGAVLERQPGDVIDGDGPLDVRDQAHQMLQLLTDADQLSQSLCRELPVGHPAAAQVWRCASSIESALMAAEVDLVDHLDAPVRSGS